MKNILKGEKGFTLIELMIIVAIIGLLSSMAIPTFIGYQAKTKQSEAKVNLAGIFSQETAYFVDKGWYGTTLPGIGFAMAGKPRYYDFTIEPPESWGPDSWVGAHGTPSSGPGAGMVVKIVKEEDKPGASPLSFTALAAGNITNSDNCDTWTISSAMSLTNEWNPITD